MLALTYEHTSSEDHFDSKFQANISPYEKSLKNPEEELITQTKSDCSKLHSELEKISMK